MSTLIILHLTIRHDKLFGGNGFRAIKLLLRFSYYHNLPERYARSLCLPLQKNWQRTTMQRQKLCHLQHEGVKHINKSKFRVYDALQFSPISPDVVSIISIRIHDQQNCANNMTSRAHYYALALVSNTIKKINEPFHLLCHKKCSLFA